MLRNIISYHYPEAHKDDDSRRGKVQMGSITAIKDLALVMAASA